MIFNYNCVLLKYMNSGQVCCTINQIIWNKAQCPKSKNNRFSQLDGTLWIDKNVLVIYKIKKIDNVLNVFPKH